MTAGTRRGIPDALLERYAANELTPELREALNARLAGSPRDQAALARIEGEFEALSKHPGLQPHLLLKRLKRRRVAKSLTFALVAGCAPLALWVASSKSKSFQGQGQGGAFPFAVNLSTDAGVRRLAPKQTIPVGSTVVFEVRAPHAGYLAVLGLDTHGTVSDYHPYGGRTGVRYQPSSPFLESPIMLTPETQRESFYAVFSSEPFLTGWAQRALQDRVPLEERAPEGTQIASFELELE